MSGKQPKCLQCRCYDSRREPFLELFRTRCARGASLKIENHPKPCPVGHRDNCKKRDVLTNTFGAPISVDAMTTSRLDARECYVGRLTWDAFIRQ